MQKRIILMKRWTREKEFSIMKPYTQDEGEDGNLSRIFFSFFFVIFLFIPICWRVNLHEELREMMMVCEKRETENGVTTWHLFSFSSAMVDIFIFTFQNI